MSRKGRRRWCIWTFAGTSTCSSFSPLSMGGDPQQPERRGILKGSRIQTWEGGGEGYDEFASALPSIVPPPPHPPLLSFPRTENIIVLATSRRQTFRQDEPLVYNIIYYACIYAHAYSRVRLQTCRYEY